MTLFPMPYTLRICSLDFVGTEITMHIYWNPINGKFYADDDMFPLPDSPFADSLAIAKETCAAVWGGSEYYKLKWAKQEQWKDLETGEIMTPDIIRERFEEGEDNPDNLSWPAYYDAITAELTYTKDYEHTPDKREGWTA